MQIGGEQRQCEGLCGACALVAMGVRSCLQPWALCLLGLLMLSLYYLNYRLYKCARLSLQYRPTELNNFIVKEAGDLSRTVYCPTAYLVEGNMHSLYCVLHNYLIDGQHGFEYERQLVPLLDGGQIALDWPLMSEYARLPQDAPVVAIIAGLTGGCRNSYVGQLIRDAAARGCKAVVLNKRGCSGTPLLVRLQSGIGSRRRSSTVGSMLRTLRRVCRRSRRSTAAARSMPLACLWERTS